MAPLTSTEQAGCYIRTSKSGPIDAVIAHAGRPEKRIRKGGGQNAIEHADVSHVTFHKLRLTAAGHLTGASISIERVSRDLGHSTVQITFMTNARILPNQM